MQYVINGAVLGATYGLIAVAYTLIYGILGLVNFAFGGIFTFGALGALVAMTPHGHKLGGIAVGFGLPVWLAVVCGVLLGTLVGVAVEIIAYRPLRGKPVLTLLVASLTMLIILQSLAQYVFGAGELAFHPFVSGTAITIFGAVLNWMDVVVLATACAVMALFGIIIERSRFGRAMRAVASDPDAAQMIGLDVGRIVVGAFALGSGLAAVSGILYASQFQVADATMGYVPGLTGLVAAVVGGVGNLPGAFAGGVIVGLLETVAAAYVPSGSQYQDAFAFAVLVLILWARPQGLFGVRVRERA